MAFLEFPGKFTNLILAVVFSIADNYLYACEDVHFKSCLSILFSSPSNYEVDFSDKKLEVHNCYVFPAKRCVVSKVIEMMLKWFNWRHLVILTDQQASGSLCPFGSASIISWLSALKTTTDYVVYPIYMSDSPSRRDIDFYLDTISQRSRGVSYIRT